MTTNDIARAIDEEIVKQLGKLVAEIVFRDAANELSRMAGHNLEMADQYVEDLSSMWMLMREHKSIKALTSANNAVLAYRNGRAQPGLEERDGTVRWVAPLIVEP